MADIVQLRPGFARALPAPAAGPRVFAPAVAGLRRLLQRWQAAAALRALGERQLRDIGLTRPEVVSPLAALTTARRRLWQL
jgi:uncharacterized protein YjiS (DUF1127 family)